MMNLDSENLVFSRWQSFCAICLYVSFAGTVYAFNIYGELLKTELGYTQSTLNVIASVGNSGNFFAVLIGFGIERCGSKSTVYFGSLCVFIGYLYIWLATIRYFTSTVESVTLFYFISQIGICCFIATAITSSIKLFPSESRGTAIGLCRAYFGLSSAVLGDLAGGVFASVPTTFVLFVAVFIPVIGILCVNMSSDLPPHLVSFDFEHSIDMDTSLTRVFYHWNYLFFVLFAVGYAQYSLMLDTSQLSACSLIVVFSALAVMVLPGTYGQRVVSAQKAEYKSLLGSFDAHSQQTVNEATALKIGGDNRVYSTGGIGGLEDGSSIATATSASCMLRRPSPSVSASNSTGSLRDFYNELCSSNIDDTDCSSPVAQSEKQNIQQSTSYSSVGGDPRECYYGASVSVQQAARTWRYWSLFFIFLVICGSGLLVIYNASDIALAAGGSASAFYVTIFALGNGMGKVVSGMISDWCVKRGHMSTLQLLALVAFSMAVVHLLLALGWSVLTFGCFFWVGLANGCAVSLVSVSTTDIFGHRYIATTLAVIDNAPLVGSYFFSTTLIALFYATNTVDAETHIATCVGGGCFRTPFLICALCCLVCTVLCYVMHLKTNLLRY